MLVGVRSGDDPDVQEQPRSLGDRVVNRLGYETGIQYAFLPSSRSLAGHPWVKEAEVLQLANIHGGWMAVTALPRLARGKRLVWCIHDMWSFTGHCGYSYGHEGWMTGCGGCPHLDAYPATRRDATSVNWRIKRSVYSKLQLDVVAPSRWLAGLARRSPLLERFEVHVIPYGVDTDLFAPLDRVEARGRLGIPAEGHVVLVAGMEPRKGSDLLGTALRTAAAELKAPVALAVAGDTANAAPPDDVPVHMLGTLDEPTMRVAYCAADAYLLPTFQDNLPNTVLEALACAVPVVATSVGGIPDVVEDGTNGRLSQPEGEALGRALAQILGNPEIRDRLGAAGRSLAAESLTLEAQADAYLGLYRRGS
jgi:glycosyltransferase involved in cell wall biosynthesis